MEQIHQFICGDGGSRSGSNTDLCATCISQDAERLTVAVTQEEGLFLTSANTAGKLTGNVGFEVKDAVAEQFLGNLDGSTQLVSADGNLSEVVIAVEV